MMTKKIYFTKMLRNYGNINTKWEEQALEKRAYGTEGRWRGQNKECKF